MNEPTFYLKSTAGTFEPATVDAVMRAAGDLAQDEIVRRGKELGPDDLKALLPAIFAGKDHEFAAVAFLDSRQRLIEFRIMAEGSQGAVALQPREVGKAALVLNSTNIVLMHNHPGNAAQPSDNDIRATLAMRHVLKYFDIKVLDQWIITGTKVYSLEENGRLDGDKEEMFSALRKLLG